MNIFSGIRKKFRKKENRPKEHTDLITALKKAESETKSHMIINLHVEEAERVKRFLDEKRLLWEGGIGLLLAYGLSDETEDELEILRREKELNMFKLGQKYATMRFRSYEYYQENKALTMRLRLMLNENKSLKKTLEKENLSCEVHDNFWDDWGEEKIDDYYRKYVFGR
jgi:hypothetical protein